MTDNLLREAAELSRLPLPEGPPEGEWCFYLPEFVLSNWGSLSREAQAVALLCAANDMAHD